MKKISFPCLEIKQPIGVFYIGAIEAKDLLAISFADVRRQEGRDLEQYLGIQRDLSPGRVADLQKYVNTIDACFPTSVIIAIKSKDVEYDENRKMLLIDNDEKVAKIIDGQHRIAGLKDYGGKFEINLTVFIDMEIEDQAMVFATINLKQTKVTKSLAYDLFEYAKSRSPQKTCHNIAKLINFRKESPLFRRIKILGKASNIDTEVITQSTFVDRIMKLITNDPMGVRDTIKRKKKLKPNNAEKEKIKFPFWNRFIKEEDAVIAKIIWNYFIAVEKNWQKAWHDFDKGKILARTTGFAALIRLLPLILENFEVDHEIPSTTYFLEFLSKSKLKDEDFTSDLFKPGSTGESTLFNNLKDDIILSNKGKTNDQ